MDKVERRARRHCCGERIVLPLGPGRGLLQIGVGSGPDRPRLRGRAAEFERLVMCMQPRDALADLGRERLLCVAGRSALRYTPLEGVASEAQDAVDQIA